MSSDQLDSLLTEAARSYSKCTLIVFGLHLLPCELEMRLANLLGWSQTLGCGETRLGL